jgi:hypothetical protein
VVPSIHPTSQVGQRSTTPPTSPPSPTRMRTRAHGPGRQSLAMTGIDVALRNATDDQRASAARLARPRFERKEIASRREAGCANSGFRSEPGISSTPAGRPSSVSPLASASPSALRRSGPALGLLSRIPSRSPVRSSPSRPLARFTFDSDREADGSIRHSRNPAYPLFNTVHKCTSVGRRKVQLTTSQRSLH